MEAHAVDGDNAAAAAFALSVQREELESLKEGRAVYVRKSKIFFKSTKQDALQRCDAKQDKQNGQDKQ